MSSFGLLAFSQKAGHTPGPGGSFIRASKYPYIRAKPAVVGSAEEIRPEVHFPLSCLRARIFRIPSLTMNGAFFSGSAKMSIGSMNWASPKSPFQGVCADHRVRSLLDFETLKSLKSSAKTFLYRQSCSGSPCAFSSRHPATVARPTKAATAGNTHLFLIKRAPIWDTCNVSEF